MLKLMPILLMLGYGLLMWQFSSWRTRRMLDHRSQPLDDPRLAPLLARMAEAADVARIPLRLYEIDAVNGLAAPDGRIFITRGFYNRFREGAISAEELASVVAHEMGHVALGHARRRMIDFTGQNAVRMLLTTVLGRLIPGVGPMLANLAASLLAARLSRRDEYEADAWASALMVKSGLGTAPQKALFAKLDALTGGGTRPPAWLLSHPSCTERIRAIEANEIRWGLPGSRAGTGTGD